MIQVAWNALKFLYGVVNVMVCTWAIVLMLCYLWATWAARDGR